MGPSRSLVECEKRDLSLYRVLPQLGRGVYFRQYDAQIGSQPGEAKVRMVVNSKDDFIKKVSSSLRSLQKLPGKVRSFFEKDTLRYAT